MRLTVKNPYAPLLGQIFFVLVCFGLVPLALMGIAGFVANREAIETRMRNVLESMVRDRKATVDLFLAEKTRQLEFTAFSYSVEQLSNSGFLETLRSKMQVNGGAIVDLGLLDDAGRQIAYSGPYNLQNLVYLHEPWFKAVMKAGRYKSDVFLGKRNLPHMVMAVKKREAGIDWVLRVTIDTDILNSLVHDGGVEPGADIFVLNRAGEYQTGDPRERRIMERADVGLILPHPGARVSEYYRNGRREFLATAWLQGNSWVLVARQRTPGLAALLPHPSLVMWLLIFGFVSVPVLSYFMASRRLIQLKALAEERAALYESVAQSQKMAAIGRLATGIAHEINNPIAIIQAQVGVLSDIVNENPEFTHSSEFRNRIDKIEAQVNRSRHVMQRLLGFARRVGTELEPVDVVAALEETISFVERDLQASRIYVVRKYSSDIPIIQSSLSQMQQVFLNLINNAMDAIREGGELQLSAERSDGGVVVKVGDTGPGIPERDFEKIFEPFYSTKSGSTPHTGLGLAICQEIMQNLKGRIEVRSTVGKGAVFSLWFPSEFQRATPEAGPLRI